MSEPIRKPDENPSRVESILSDTIGLSGYEIEAPRSRIEILLLELEELIKEGGGGGESSNYGTSISIEMDSNFVMSASLLNKDGEVLGEVQTIDLPLESVVVNGSYDSINKQVVLTLQNGSAVRFSVADLVDGLQTEITSQNPLNADLVSDSNSTHKFTTASDISKLAGIEAQANKTVVDSSITDGGTNPVTGGSIYTALAGKLGTDTHYAGSSTTGGSATSAAKLDNSTDAGSSTNPVYFSNGIPIPTTYSLSKSVPANAVFTDTTYESKAASDSGTDVSLCTTGEKYAWNNKQNALSTTQLDAVNSGIDSTKVAQIETNENNILLNWETNRNVYDWHNKTFIIGDSTTFTDNNNGTYTVTKSSTTAANSYNYTTIHLDAGSYVLTGCPSGYSGIVLEIRDVNGVPVSGSGDTGSGSSVFTITTSGDYRLNILLAAYATVSNITFKPMITLSSVYYQGITYQPYAMSNAELTAKEQQNENNISFLTANCGGKNKLNLIISEIKSLNVSGTWAGDTYTRNGVDFTINSDLSITVNASSAATALATLELKINTPTFTTATTLSGCPSGGNYDSTYALYTTDSNGNTTARDTGSGVDITNKSIAKIRILVRGGYKPTNLIFKPMICDTAIYNSEKTYQPYAPSNRELYEMILALQ